MTEKEWLSFNNPAKLKLTFLNRFSLRKLQLCCLAACQTVRPYLEETQQPLLKLLERAIDKEPGVAEQMEIARCKWLPVWERQRRQKRKRQDRSPSAAFALLYYPFHYVNFPHTTSLFVTCYLAQQITKLPFTHFAQLVRDILGNPFREMDWGTHRTVQKNQSIQLLARTIYSDHQYSLLPILADALEEEGVPDENLIQHCRSTEPHAHGCWAIDELLGLN